MDHAGEQMNEQVVSPRRIGAAAAILSGEPEAALAVLDRLDNDELANIGEIVRQLTAKRAIARGDHDSIIAHAFEVGFGRDGLAMPPWVESGVIVCPGGLVAKSRANHRCRFVSVNDCWVWDSGELIREDKRSTPGPDDGFRAVALVPAISGIELDVVTGKARAGQHSLDAVTSYEVRKGQLVEVSQRVVAAAGMR